MSSVTTGSLMRRSNYRVNRVYPQASLHRSSRYITKPRCSMVSMPKDCSRETHSLMKCPEGWDPKGASAFLHSSPRANLSFDNFEPPTVFLSPFGNSNPRLPLSLLLSSSTSPKKKFYRGVCRGTSQFKRLVRTSAYQDSKTEKISVILRQREYV